MLSIILLFLIISAVALYFLSGKIFKKELKCSIVNLETSPSPGPTSDPTSDGEETSQETSQETSSSPGPGN